MKLYRSREGLILGVCQGLADATGFPVRYFRLAVLLLIFLTRGWFLAVYFAAALLLPARYRGADTSSGFRANCEIFLQDAEELIRKEYRDIRAAMDNRKH